MNSVNFFPGFRRAGARAAAGFGLLVAGLAGAGSAQPAPVLRTRVVASGLSEPVFAAAPAGDLRLFIVERAGRILILEGGAVLPVPFLDLSDVVNASGERGLLGLAFDPGFASNRRLFVNYIDRSSLHTVVATYQASAIQPNRAEPASRQLVLTVAQPAFDNHKAGWIGFRPGDGSNLYIATGDGGGANDPQNRAQNPFDNLGKILRIDVSVDRFPADAGIYGYAIPPGNMPGGNPEIYATGLRNPFRNSFDRETGEFYIADVGQGAREEINLGIAGGNYGWRKYEGTRLNFGGDAEPPAVLAPIHEYTPGPRRATVIGGYVYRGTEIAGLGGTYFFADYMSDQVMSFRRANGGVVELADRSGELLSSSGVSGNISSFGEDGFGNLYLVSLDGQVGRIESAAIGAGRPARLRALSVRSLAGQGAATLITGIVASGPGPKQVVVRAVGPSLAEPQYGGLSGGLANPELRLFDGGGQSFAFNDDWGGGAELAGAFGRVGLAPLAAGSRDAALVTALPPGGYTTHVTSAAGAGVALMEVYDGDGEASPARLSALSARSSVGSGAEILILGFVITGDAPLPVLVRGLGPALLASGVTDVLENPRVALFAGGTALASNDNWGGSAALTAAFAAVGLPALPPDSRDAALLVTLAPGVYTAQLSGVADTTGIGLIEIYEVPGP